MTPFKRKSHFIMLSLTGSLMVLIGVTIWCVHWWNTAWTPDAQIVKYRIEDILRSNAAGQNLILGSSTAKGLPSDLSYCGQWVNRGIGNGTTRDFLRYITETDSRPLQNILVYTGENDIAFGISVERALVATSLLIETLREKFSPRAILLLPIKLSPARAKFEPKFLEFNRGLETLAQQFQEVELLHHSLTVRPGSKSSYASDGLHLSKSGYDHLLHSLKRRCI